MLGSLMGGFSGWDERELIRLRDWERERERNLGRLSEND
jgi:hypothetical protein